MQSAKVHKVPLLLNELLQICLDRYDDDINSFLYYSIGMCHHSFNTSKDEEKYKECINLAAKMGYSDAKNWYEVGEATIRVSTDFKAFDNADLDLGEVTYYPGDFLVGAVTNYDFTPYNTTVRVEGGQIVELNRVYIP